MSTVLHAAALICVAAGLVAGAVAGLATRDGRLALRVAMDFWLSAGLLQLAGPRNWSSIAVAALVIVARQAASTALGRSPGGDTNRNG